MYLNHVHKLRETVELPELRQGELAIVTDDGRNGDARGAIVMGANNGCAVVLVAGVNAPPGSVLVNREALVRRIGGELTTWEL